MSIIAQLLYTIKALDLKRPSALDQVTGRNQIHTSHVRLVIKKEKERKK
jgi:hypothetical protein